MVDNSEVEISLVTSISNSGTVPFVPALPTWNNIIEIPTSRATQNNIATERNNGLLMLNMSRIRLSALVSSIKDLEVAEEVKTAILIDVMLCPKDMAET